MDNTTGINACGKGIRMLPNPPPRTGLSGRPRKYTLEFLLSVPDLISKSGLTLDQIAASVGGKPSTIVELCYRYKITLPARRKHRVFVRVRFSTVKKMQAYASAQGINFNELAERLLETIAQDNMFKAILED